ncbi:MAG: EAL domain-containing protein [Bacillota bacterium]
MKLAIDDFGIGFSSLSILKHLPIDKLKIDKSFIADLSNNINGKQIVKTIITMGNNLNFIVLAEGIENSSQLLFLREAGCNLGQGYYFCRPLTSGKLRKFIISELQKNNCYELG